VRAIVQKDGWTLLLYSISNPQGMSTDNKLNIMYSVVIYVAIFSDVFLGPDTLAAARANELVVDRKRVGNIFVENILKLQFHSIDSK